VMVDDVTHTLAELTTDQFEVVQIRGGEDRCWNHYVRVQ
jgi:hypothetical protein